ncbi:hypothetical protein, partial [Pseudomonas sp. GM21]|uniref:hypothetical protein n=1 Tax=Pseudomonas sp. GM21 TaxID=1144325 RepID=UPI001EE6428D
HFHADHPVFSCSKIEQKQLNTWVSFQSAEQPLLGQFSVSGNSQVFGPTEEDAIPDQSLVKHDISLLSIRISMHQSKNLQPPVSAQPSICAIYIAPDLARTKDTP